MNFPHCRRVVTVFRVLALLLFAAAVVRVAWIGDDALITLRTALNITHEWGPGYNATESVQAFTHPLWFVLWVLIGSATNQWILGVLFMSVVFTVGAVALVLWRTADLSRLILVTALLLLSNAFMDFSTGGLENPLSFLLAGTLVVLTLAGDQRRERLGLWWPALIGLSAAALFLTRMDFAVLMAVPLLVVLWQARRRWMHVLLGIGALVVPLVVWFTWSWLVYATWLPNTFAAKQNSVIPRSELLVQGFRYFWVSFENDPVTMIGLAAGLAIGLAFGGVMLRAWSLGVLAYLGYVLWIGGDFMAGRFLSVPLYVAVLIIAASPMRLGSEKSDTSGSYAALAGSVASVLLLVVAGKFAGTQFTSLENPQAPRWEVDQNVNGGVSDERGTYVADGDSLKLMLDQLSLWYAHPDYVPIGDGTGLGRTLREINKAASNWPTNDGGFTNPSEVGVFCGYLGNIGIATGPTTHLIDYCALTDRFLAETPAAPREPFAWKPWAVSRIPDSLSG